MPGSNSAWLQEIADWQLEAADEDNSRYFLKLSDVDRVKSGRARFVLGRKGSGKTAVAEHLKGLKSHDVFVRTLSFKNFPFEELYRLADARFTNPSRYTTIWRYLIYYSVCSMMADNAAIDPSVSKQLANHFSLDVERGLAQSVSKISDRSGGFTVLGTGLNASSKSVSFPNDASWEQRADILENILNTYLDESTYYVLFDELDEDYNDILDVAASKQYFDLLKGLFKAAQGIKRAVRPGLNVLPVVFLREDIFEFLRDNEKNKWLDSAVTLRWSEAQLRRLTAFRLSRALDEHG